MWLILCHHFVVHNVDAISVVSGPVTRAFLHVIFYPAGRVGVGIFVTITAWFLSGTIPSLRSSLRKVWLLDRQLIFYSVGIFVALCIGGLAPFGPTSLALSFFPLLTGVWWFPTTYAAYLLMIPFVLRGLQALSKTEHLRLSALLLVLYGILQFVPHVGLSSVIDSLLAEFLVITVIISYLRWHATMDDIRDARLKLLVAAIGAIALIALSYKLSGTGVPFLSTLARNMYQSVVVNPASVLSLAISIPAVLLVVSARPWRSKLVNRVASLAFGVYLLTDYPAMWPIIWSGPLALGNVANVSPGIVSCVLVVSGIYLTATLVDAVRSLLFSLTIDQRPGRLFDVVWQHLTELR